MGRPTKQGLDYFPVECNFDSQVQLLIVEKNAESLSVLLTLWQMIYSDEGYYVKYNDDLPLLIKSKINTDINYINDVINTCFRRQIFDKSMYKKYGILTSKGIQKRFLKATEKRKRIIFVREYLLLEVNDELIGINVEFTQLMLPESTQSKVKESKVKKIIGEISQTTGNIHDIDSAKKNKVPFQKIISLYHDILSELPKIEKLTKAREGYIRQRWLQDLSSLDAWENYFNYVKQSDFLMGRISPRDDRQPFRATLEWLVKPGNYAKVAEEKYHG